MRRIAIMTCVVAVLLTACSTNEAQISEPPEPDPLTLDDDKRFDGEHFTRAEKVDICTQISASADASEVLDGTPHLEIVEDDDWFCRITGIDWITVPEAATIELAFYEYTDDERQNLSDEVSDAGHLHLACELVIFYDGDIDLNQRGYDPTYCQGQAPLYDTAFLIQDATATTINLQLGGTAEEHTLADLDRDNITLRTDIIDAIYPYIRT